MQNINLYAIAIFTALSLMFSPILWASINEPTGEAADIISKVADSHAIKYYNSADWKAEDKTLPDLAELSDLVINQQQRVLVDFSQVSDAEGQAEMQAQFRKTYGLGFTNQFIAITEHKGGLLFTPFDQSEEIDPALLEAPRTEHLLGRSGFTSTASVNSDMNIVPNVAFYISVNRAISDADCTFTNSWLWKNEKGSRPFCKDANISLIYRVNLERSLQYDVGGTSTPDAKIVRISLDDDSTGAGIHLNDQLGYRNFQSSDYIVDGYFREWSTDAIAQDYSVSFYSDTALLLKTFPVDKINENVDRKEFSNFELGVTGWVDGPKGKVEAKGRYNQTRGLTYNTQDYRIEVRRFGDDHGVEFKWNRARYATVKSLLNRQTDATWVNTYPVDRDRISPNSYVGFVPKTDVIYKASATETGITYFMIAPSVNIRPLYHGAYKHYYLVGMHQSYHGFDDESTPRRQINKQISFNVDWDHAVFMGGRPVNLQLASFNNRCIQVDAQGSLMANTCDSQKSTQSFIYDQLGRYVSANNTKLCLDGAALDALQTCNQNLTQRWEWRKGTDELTNVHSGESLGHDKQTGKLGLYASSNNAVSLRTVTAYTDVFNAALSPNKP
ncbi:leukocidin family pore-forming toxin [Aeromonas jandaei]|uniref:leukocidin family pore-forming toxin n=1 Tax=Aeromonas jandaei TaxID=650 RepID=UPI00191E59DE|nr:leukocidin family pore-forming toxin [Aeromonas jandaei]